MYLCAPHTHTHTHTHTPHLNVNEMDGVLSNFPGLMQKEGTVLPMNQQHVEYKKYLKKSAVLK